MIPRNILTDLDAALLAMAAIEDRRGDSWLTRQLEAVARLEGIDLDIFDIWDRSKHHVQADSISNAVEYTIGQAIIQCSQGFEMRQEGIACIVYGDGGWNRWGVRYNGEVIFSRYHTRSGDLEKVIAAGFGVW